MNAIQLILQAQAPLAIGRSKPGGSISQTENYIPGSVIRGAIASEMIRLSGEQSQNYVAAQDDFNALFLDGNAAIFHNAYPVGYGEIKKTPPTRVIPSTAATAKSNPGFSGKGAGVFDTLIDRFCARGHGQIYDPVFPDEEGGRVEPMSGFYQEIKSRTYKTCNVSTRLLTKAGINRRRTTSEDQILYSVEVMNETEESKKDPTCFSCFILCPEAPVFKPLVKFLNDRTIRVGGSASRGLGKVKLLAQADNSKSDFKTRYEAFNKCLDQQWKQWSQLFTAHDDFKRDRCFFSIGLESDAILQDDWKRTMVLSPKLLQEFARLVDLDLRLEGSSCSYDYVSGWNSAWGLMKDTDLITQKGACFLFSIKREREADWLKALEALEKSGVGDRRTEGFGQIYICNPFHLNIREHLV